MLINPVGGWLDGTEVFPPPIEGGNPADGGPELEGYVGEIGSLGGW